MRQAWANAADFGDSHPCDHQVCLQSGRGRGYRWVPPHEQTGVAMEELGRNVRKVFRSTGQKLRNLRVTELTDDQRRDNLDQVAKFSALRGMATKTLRWLCRLCCWITAASTAAIPIKRMSAAGDNVTIWPGYDTLTCSPPRGREVAKRKAH